MKNSKGFTLIEIVVVMVIIGIIAGVALTTYYDSMERAHGPEAKEVLYKSYAGFQRLAIDQEVVNATFPLTWTRLGMSDPNVPAKRFFNYGILPDANNPDRVRAVRLGDVNRWLEINLTSGQLTQSAPY